MRPRYPGVGHIASLRPMDHLSEADRHRHRNDYWSSYTSCQDEGSPKAEPEVVSRSPSSPIRHKARMIVEIIPETLLTSLGYQIYLNEVSRTPGSLLCNYCEKRREAKRS